MPGFPAAAAADYQFDTGDIFDDEASRQLVYTKPVSFSLTAIA